MPTIAWKSAPFPMCLDRWITNHTLSKSRNSITLYIWNTTLTTFQDFSDWHWSTHLKYLYLWFFYCSMFCLLYKSIKFITQSVKFHQLLLSFLIRNRMLLSKPRRVEIGKNISFFHVNIDCTSFFFASFCRYSSALISATLVDFCHWAIFWGKISWMRLKWEKF